MPLVLEIQMSVEQFTDELKKLNDAHDNGDLNGIDQGHTNLETVTDQARPGDHISVEVADENKSSEQSTSTS